MRSHFLKKWIAIIALLMMAGCANSRKAPTKTSSTEASKTVAPQPVTGETAFWAMYKLAFAWARDLEPLTLDSGDLPNMKCEAGKAPIWKANFGSPSLHEVRTFTYSVLETPDLTKGVNVGPPIPWGGPTQSVMPILTASLHTDSDAAYQSALADAGVWVKAHPGRPVSISLGRTYRFALPVWYVLWGNDKSGYAVFVDADDGKVIHRK